MVIQLYRPFLHFVLIAELVEEHQVEIETIKADYDEQQAEFKVSNCYLLLTEYSRICPHRQAAPQVQILKLFGKKKPIIF